MNNDHDRRSWRVGAMETVLQAMLMLAIYVGVPMFGCWWQLRTARQRELHYLGVAAIAQLAAWLPIYGLAISMMFGTVKCGSAPAWSIFIPGLLLVMLGVLWLLSMVELIAAADRLGLARMLCHCLLALVLTVGTPAMYVLVILGIGCI